MPQIKCKACPNYFEPKRVTAEFCSAACRAKWNRGMVQEELIAESRQEVVYDLTPVLSELAEIKGLLNEFFSKQEKKPTNLLFPPDPQEGQYKLSVFQKFKKRKEECQTEDEWKDICVEIVLSNLADKQKQMLIDLPNPMPKTPSQ